MKLSHKSRLLLWGLAGAVGLLALQTSSASAQTATASPAATPSLSPAGSPALSSTNPTTDLGNSFSSQSPSRILYDSSEVGPSYVLGPGDAVSINVVPQARYSVAQLPVLQDGALDYPVIGKVQATGRTTDEIAADVKSKLSVYCVNPDVTVTLVALRPQVIFITGGVYGQKALDAHAASTLAKAITLAGGVPDRNTLTHVAVIRGKQVLTANMYPLLVKGIDNGENLALQPNDLVVVPVNTAKVTILGATNSQGVWALDDLGATAEAPVRLSDALSRAGGTKGRGDARIGQVALLRQSTPGAKPQITKYDYGKFLKTGDEADNPVLQDNDMIVVPEENHPVNLGSIMNYFPFYYLLKGL